MGRNYDRSDLGVSGRGADGAAPGANHGADTEANGDGLIKEHRLYQLIRQAASVGEHVFSIEFLDSDVQAYSFTLG